MGVVKLRAYRGSVFVSTGSERRRAAACRGCAPWLPERVASQKIPQPRKLYDVLGGQYAQNKRRLGSRVDLIQVPRCLGLCHELPDTLIERAGSDHIRLSIWATLIVERRPFPQLSRGGKVDWECFGHRSAPLD